MISSPATVTSIAGGHATLAIDSRTVCPRCAEGKGCGAGLFNGPRARELQVQVPEGLRLASGDTVSVVLGDSGILRAALLGYGLPLAAVLLSLSLAWLALGPLSDPAGVAIALAGLVAGWLLSRRQLQSATCLARIQPRLARDTGASR